MLPIATAGSVSRIAVQCWCIRAVGSPSLLTLDNYMWEFLLTGIGGVHHQDQLSNARITARAATSKRSLILHFFCATIQSDIKNRAPDLAAASYQQCESVELVYGWWCRVLTVTH